MRKIFFVIGLCLFHVIYSVELTISSPGIVQLGEDITFNPAATSDSIIRISASNVTLDLGERIISQGNTTANTLGIVVDDNLSNITITNGTIFNLTGTAIRVGQNCQNITISNIETFTCGGRGVELNFADSTATNNCFLKNLNIIDVRGEGIYVGHSCERIIMEDILIDRGAINLFGINCSGQTANRISSCMLKNIVISRCGSGVRLFNAHDCKLENIRILNSTSTGSFSGFFVAGATGAQARGNVLTNCTVEGVTGSTDAAGYRLEQAGQNVLKDCTVKYETNSIAAARGFYIFSTSQNNILINCSALNVFGTGVAGEVWGYQMEGTSNFMVIDCESLSTDVSGGAVTLGDAYRCETSDCGIYKRTLSINPHDENYHAINNNSDLIYRNCQASCPGDDGFTVQDSLNVILDGCTAIMAQGSTDTADAFIIIGCSDVLMSYCSAYDSPGHGFFVLGTGNDDISLCDCLATNCGDGYENDDEATVVLKCKATNCTVGFDNDGGAGPDFALNMAMGNGTNYIGVANPVGPLAAKTAGGNLDA